MKVSFFINYHTQWGQQIAITGPGETFGEWNMQDALIMNHLGNGWWNIELELEDQSIEYKYTLITNSEENAFNEGGHNRRVDLSSAQGRICIIDSWRIPNAVENAFFTSAFNGLIFQPDNYSGPDCVNWDVEKGNVVRFQLDCPQVKKGQRICLLGGIAELGNWDLDDAILMYKNEGSTQWYFDLPIEELTRFEYKYGLFDEETETLIGLETGSNRSLNPEQFGEGDFFIKNDEYFRHPNGLWKGSGMAIPVFSIRTEDSLGVGEFLDIKKLVDWSSKVGMQMVQILPVNDTTVTHTWKDSYPYAGISVFALHPLYLNIEAIGNLDKEDKKLYVDERSALNALNELDYDKVISIKTQLARKLYLKDGGAFLEEDAFKAFMEANESWLKPYAAFSYLRDKYENINFNEWETGASFSDELIEELSRPGTDSNEEMGFYYFLQFHLHQQLKEASDYARSKEVVLKGDIPIGIYRYSVDAWVAPELYNMDGQAGAPPDDFAVNGQNWGFPTYNWDRMAEDGFDWWKKRFQHLSNYFDAFRIDHILGFFRIWEIPIDQIDGLFGRFNKALPVQLNEFAERGIPFDYDRFCKPFITNQLLADTFKKYANLVATKFLDQTGENSYQLKEAFQTQKQIKEFFEEVNADSEAEQKLMRQLMDLVNNVLFFEEPGSNQSAFHPRISFQNTHSFKALEPSVRDRLNSLYNDYFFSRQESFWREQGLAKLPAIKSATNMLVCGEDLGMVPECVPKVMNALNILSLEIQRMSKNPKTEFLSAQDIPYLSVSSPSTHDMAPVRAWWEKEESDYINRFYYNVLGMGGSRPFFCEPYVVEGVIKQHLDFPSMWVVFPLQDILALDKDLRRGNPFEERINDPSNPEHYWRYRMHLSVEELLQQNGLNDRLKRMLEKAGR